MRREDDDESVDALLIESSPMSRRRAAKKKANGKFTAWWSSLDFTNQETHAMLLTGAVTSLLVFLTLVAFLDSRTSLLLYGAGLYIGLPAAIAVGMFGTALQFNISFPNAAFRWIAFLGIGWGVFQLVDHFQLPRGVSRGLGMALYFCFQPTMT
jgi:uncharacterized oligopeptide transporter (OPT) family protein